VTRVGGVGQNKRQKALAAALNKTLAGYRVAEEYAHFGTELSPEAQSDYDKGKALFRLMNQDIGEGYSLMDQQFLLDLVLNTKPEEQIDIKKVKELVKEYSAKVQEDKDMKGNWDQLRDELKSKVVIIDEKKAAAIAKEAAAAAAKAAEAEKAAGDAVVEQPGEAGKTATEGDKKEDKKPDNKDAQKADEKPAADSAKGVPAEPSKDDEPADEKPEDEKPADKAPEPAAEAKK